jgi:hypothetical protein
MKMLTPTLAAYAAGKAIAPLWVAPNGRAFYPIAGGSEGAPEPVVEGAPVVEQPAKTYTPPASQEELDRIVGARLSREREKFADYEALKQKAAEHDAALEAAKTDQEKAIDAARKEGESSAVERTNAAIVRVSARALAAESGALNSATAVAVLDLSGITVTADGTVDEAALKTKIAELKTAQPFLFGTPGKPGPRPDPSQGGGSGGGETAPSVARGREMFENRRGKKTSA